MVFWIKYQSKSEIKENNTLKTSEFDLIDRFFKPLCPEGAPAYGLKNDAATYSPPEGCELVFTKDTLVSDVHFFFDDKPGLIAQKALRVNLSDLAAMGAKPVGYLLSMALPKPGLDVKSWVQDFTEGLSRDQDEFGLKLWGGDSVSTTGPIIISVTAIGFVNQGAHLTRDGANVGDDIYVTGTLGDAAAALLLIKENNDEFPALLNRYYLPAPRLAVGSCLHNIASAVMDVSDGLMGDISHICQHSEVGAEIFLDKIPLSKELGNFLETKKEYSHLIWGGGDDYELLFTAPLRNANAVKKLASDTNCEISRIGKITAGNKAIILDQAGTKINVNRVGFRHF